MSQCSMFLLLYRIWCANNLACQLHIFMWEEIYTFNHINKSPYKLLLWTECWQKLTHFFNQQLLWTHSLPVCVLGWRMPVVSFLPLGKQMSHPVTRVGMFTISYISHRISISLSCHLVLIQESLMMYSLPSADQTFWHWVAQPLIIDNVKTLFMTVNSSPSIVMAVMALPEPFIIPS